MYSFLARISEAKRRSRFVLRQHIRRLSRDFIIGQKNRAGDIPLGKFFFGANVQQHGVRVCVKHGLTSSADILRYSIVLSPSLLILK
jgi:hypothetical protein